MFIILFLITLLPPLMISANLEKELNHFFESIGSSSNVNSSEIYNGQKAGYATGGGISIRNQSMKLQPLSVSLPRFDAGCGGIDIYTGGFSFVNSEQLIQALKSVGSGAIGYAFLLGLETVSPQVANTIKQMQTWSNNINSQNINSCELASQLVGSVWPKDSLARQHICQSTSTHYGWLSDRIDARQQCSTLKKRNDFEQKVKENNPDLLGSNYNIAWEAIQKQNFIAKDTEVCEFLMTLMGTIIVNGERIDIFPAKANEESFVKTLLEGGEASIYSCDSTNKNQCLVVSLKKMVIDKRKSWGGKIEDLLLSIQNKILKDEELSQEERELLIKTHLPIYKFLNVLTAYKKGICPIDLKQISEIVAMDLLVYYLKDALETVRVACGHLKNNTPYSDKIDEYLLSLQSVEKSILYYDKKASHLMEQELYILQKLDLLESQIASELCL